MDSLTWVPRIRDPSIYNSRNSNGFFDIGPISVEEESTTVEIQMDSLPVDSEGGRMTSTTVEIQMDSLPHAFSLGQVHLQQ